MVECLVEVLDSLKVCFMVRLLRFLILRMWLEKMFFLFFFLMVSRFCWIV